MFPTGQPNAHDTGLGNACRRWHHQLMPSGLLDDALRELAGSISVEEAAPRPGTHRAFKVDGLCSGPAEKQVAIVLTGLIAQAVALDLELVRALGQDRGSVQRWLEPAVHSVVGIDNDSSNSANPDKTTERDPWIAEALVHVLALLARHHDADGLPKGIIARTELPTTVKSPGIDLITLHVDSVSNEPSLCIAETKASKLYGQQRLSEAIGFLSGVDKRDHDLEIRIKLNTLSQYVPPAVWDRIPTMLLHTDPHLLPAIFHESGSGFQWSVSRRMAAISHADSRVRLLAFPVRPWDEFFDYVADRMRQSVGLFGDD